MSQSSSDQIVKLLLRNERKLSEVKQCLDALTHKVDLLANRSIIRNQPEVSNPVALANENPLFEPNSFGIFDDPYSAQGFPNLGSLQPTLNDPHMLPPRTAPASMVYRDGVWMDPPPSTPRVFPNPLPNMIPSNEVWGYEVCDGGNDGGGEGSVYLSAEERTNVSAQVAEMSTSLAAAKPENIKDNVWSESSTPVASSSGGGYDRARNAEEKIQRFEQICEALGITLMGDELSTLQAIIKSMGGIAPNVEEPTGGMAGADRERGSRKRKAIRACFEVLQNIVGPPTDKISYNKVLSDVLASVTARVGEPPRDGGKPYGVFRLRNW